MGLFGSIDLRNSINGPWRGTSTWKYELAKLKTMLTSSSSNKTASTHTPLEELTIEIARLAVQTGLVPLYEAYPDQPLKVRKLSKHVPVTEYLRSQKRFSHLFKGQDDQVHLALIQAIADENVARYGLGK